MLRVGIVLESLIQPAWVARLVGQVQSSDIAQIVLVAIAGAKPGGEPAPRRRWLDPHLLYRLYSAADAHLFRVSPDAFAPVSIEDALHDCVQICLDKGAEVREFAPRHVVRAGDKPPSDGGSSAKRVANRDGSTGFNRACLGQVDLEAIQAQHLDVVLALGVTPDPSQAPALARYGVWFFHHGEELGTWGTPPGFWEVMEGRPVTGSLLAAWTDDSPSAARVLYRSYAPTDNRSVRRNNNNYFWKTSDFFTRQLRALAEAGPAALAESERVQPARRDPRRHQTPTNPEVAPALARLGARYLGEKLRHLADREQWFIAYSLDGARPETADPAYRELTALRPPVDRFWADPFPVEYEGGFLIFFEEFLYPRGKAHLSVLRVGPDGRHGEPVKILERPYHLSYPFIFEWDGDYFMIPETGGNRAVELYRARRFPFEWTFEKTLLEDLRAVDATLARIDGIWWLFTNVAVEGAINQDELHLFYADSPLGPWTPHRGNPVRSDARSARPAGRIIAIDGVQYRPSQDCSGRYGSAVVVNQICRIDPEYYVEKEAGRLAPLGNQKLLGTHTLNRCAGLICLDGVARTRRLLGASPADSFAIRVALATAAGGNVHRWPRNVPGGVFRASGGAAALFAEYCQNNE